jgi:hypothetical protein
MNTPATTPQERITRLVQRAIVEAKRRNRGPIYHLLARLHELDSETERYKIAQKNERRMTLDHAGGMRAALAFAVALIMKYRHRTAGVTTDEVDVALRRLTKGGVFITIANEDLPAAA